MRRSMHASGISTPSLRCAEQGIDWLDLNRGLTDNNGLKARYTTDGTHLTKEGYSIWAEALRQQLGYEKNGFRHSSLFVTGNLCFSAEAYTLDVSTTGITPPRRIRARCLLWFAEPAAADRRGTPYYNDRIDRGQVLFRISRWHVQLWALFLDGRRGQGVHQPIGQ